MILYIKAKKIRQAAYTLAEVLITVFLVTVVVVSLYAGFSSGLSVVQSTRENLRATQILVQWMETARLYNWSQINNSSFVLPKFSEVYDPASLATNAGGTLYIGNITRQTPTNLPAAYNTNMVRLTVTVYWTNYSKNKTITQSRQMQTYVARSGLQNYVFGNQ